MIALATLHLNGNGKFEKKDNYLLIMSYEYKIHHTSNLHRTASSRTHRSVDKLHRLRTHLVWQRLQCTLQVLDLPPTIEQNNSQHLVASL